MRQQGFQQAVLWRQDILNWQLLGFDHQEERLESALRGQEGKNALYLAIFIVSQKVTFRHAGNSGDRRGALKLNVNDWLYSELASFTFSL